VGNGATTINIPPNAIFKFYVADRPGQTSRSRAAEIVLDVTITLTHRVDEVWPIFKDFDLWMGRYGYFWNGVFPADNEDKFVYLGNKAGANDTKYGTDGTRTKYIVRKVIPERLMYFDSLPSPIPGKDGVWMGHNVISLYEEGGQTRIVTFMEHTWYSETMTIDELRAEAKGALEGGTAFWRDYFVPDLNSAIESRLAA
jgi:hypothetical protein